MTRGMRRLLLICLLLGCPSADDDDSGAPDDDDAAGDDDDTAGGTCSTAGSPGQIEDVPCAEPGFGDPWIGDTWSITLAAGDTLAVTVDTVSGASTFDPRVRIIDAMSTWLAAGDDDCACAWSAGPGYGCAEASHRTDFGEFVRVQVAGFLEEACASGTGGYVLRATVNGEVASPILIDDDAPTLFD